VRSQLFSTEGFKEVEARVQAFLNTHQEFLSPGTASSTRAVGDAVAALLAENFQAIVEPWCTEYSANFARRAMADLAFKDVAGCYYVVDVKTHREDTKFNMPNLTSVERLTRFYEDDSNYFVILMLKYNIQGNRALVTDTLFAPIEFLGWECLTIGALGWGQIQIANSNQITLRPKYSRKRWMLELCDMILDFYPREITKINERIEHFQSVRDHWLAKPDDV
jgi:hypothetical protein